MAIRWTDDSEHGVLRVTLSGEWPSVRTRREALEAMADAGFVRTDLPVLIDMRDVQPDLMPRFDDLLKSFFIATEIGGRSRRALLAQPGSGYGVARMIAARAPVGAPLEVFTDEAAAIDWLRSNDGLDNR